MLFIKINVKEKARELGVREAVIKSPFLQEEHVSESFLPRLPFVFQI